MQMSFFPWEVTRHEKGTDYYKSLTPDYVCGPLIHKGKGLLEAAQEVIENEDKVSSDEDHDQNYKVDGGDESMYNRTTSPFVRSPDDPPSRKKLFEDTDFQTHKVRFNLMRIFSVVYYNCLVSLSKEKGVGVGGFGEGLDGTLNDFLVLYHKYLGLYICTHRIPQNISHKSKW
jgi:hypothetical protein